MYRCAACLWHATISGDVASARAPDGLITVDSTARAIKRSSTAAFPTRGRGGMLARSIEIGHPYFRSGHSGRNGPHRKALGITLPTSVGLRADEVIESTFRNASIDGGKST